MGGELWFVRCWASDMRWVLRWRGWGRGEEVGGGLWALWGSRCCPGRLGLCSSVGSFPAQDGRTISGGFLRINFFFLRVPGPSWTPGVRDIHAGLSQCGSRQEGAGGALVPPRGEVSSSAGTSVPWSPPATTSPPSLPRECSTLDSAIGLTELS